MEPCKGSLKKGLAAGLTLGLYLSCGSLFLWAAPGTGPTPSGSASPAVKVMPHSGAKPSATPHPGAKPSATPHPLAKPSATAHPGAKPSAAPHPGAKPSATAHPGSKPSATPHPVAKPSATPRPGAKAGGTSKGKPTPSPAVKEIPLVHVGDLVVRRPGEFHRIEDTRERMIFEANAQDGWCQLAIGQKELGEKTRFNNQDAKKLGQTLFPYLDKGKGTRWKPFPWLGQPGYRVEFSGTSANVRMFSAQTFIVRGGLLLWAGINCPEPQRVRWQPLYEDWLKSAHLK